MNQTSDCQATKFPADQPDCVIDWILVSGDCEFDSYRVVPSEVSDHRMVLFDMTIGQEGEVSSN